MLIPHSRPFIDQEDVSAVSDVLSSGNIAQGEKVREFECAIARFIGTKYAVACSSGTSALHLALLSLGLVSQDEIIMPSYVCSSPYLAISHAGAKPRIVDIDLLDLNICASNIKKELNIRTKAIIAPHMFGCPAELDRLVDFGIPLIEDCAQSLGAEYNKRRVGCFGDLSTFSFYATKMITTGEGGMVLTNNEEFYSKIVDYRDYDKKPLVPARYNYKMTDFQAALGLSQLRKLPYFIERRRHIASVYAERFSRFPIEIPIVPSHKKSVFYRYVIRSDRMKNIQERAKKKEVMCQPPVFEPIHKNVANVECPNSDMAFEKALSIPLYPSLTDEEIEYLIQTLSIILG